MSNLEIYCPSGDGPGHLCLEGEATIYNAAELKARLLEEAALQDHLELDLSKVQEIDTAGLQVLLLVAREQAASGQPCRWIRPSPAVVSLFDLCGLESPWAEDKSHDQH